MNLMIFGAEFGGNKGAEAMLMTFLQFLQRKHFSGTVYLEKHPLHTPSAYQEKCDQFSTESMKVTWFSFSPSKIIMNTLQGYRSPEGNKIQMDYGIDLGGLAFADTSIKGSIRNYFRYVPLQLRKVPYSFFIQDLGPMNFIRTRLIARLAFWGARIVFTRSRFSHNLANKLIPRKGSGPWPDMTHALNTGDAVLDRLPPSLTENLAETIIISPSIILFQSEGPVYIKFLEQFIQEVRKTNPVLLLVHTFYHGQREDDSSLTQKLFDNIQTKENAKADNSLRPISILNENLDTRILKKLISKSKGVLSSRFHVLVAGLSTNVPCTAIGWNPKYQELFSQYQLPLSEVHSTADAKETAQHFLGQCTEESRQNLRNANEASKQKLNEAFDTLWNELCSSSNGALT